MTAFVLSDVQLEQIRGNPQEIITFYNQYRDEFIAVMGLPVLSENALIAAWSSVVAHQLVPYGPEPSGTDLNTLLHAPSLACDQYVTLTWRLIDLFGISTNAQIAVGWDDGAVGNHAQMLVSSGDTNLLLDPTIGLVAYGVTLNGLFSGVHYTQYASFYHYPADTALTGFNTKVITAINTGQYELQDIIYDVSGLDNWINHYSDYLGYEVHHGDSDLVIGFLYADTISTGAGDDTVFGGKGDDIIILGDGNDIGLGGKGNDYLYGGHGNDNLNGESGNDILIDSDGLNIEQGGDGNDYIYGGVDQDLVYGGPGDDVVLAGNGPDIIVAEAGNDYVYAGDGNDYVYAGEGNDIIYGGAGYDVLLGEAGDDYLSGDGATNTVDYLFGGTGKDTFFVQNLPGATVIQDFNLQEGDILLISGSGFTFDDLKAHSTDYDSFSVITINDVTNIWIIGQSVDDYQAGSFWFI